MFEIEAKIRVDDFSGIRSRLETGGASRVGVHDETNTFFDTPDRRLLAGGKGLRLRHQHDRSTGQEKFILTFKGPCQPGPLKKRDERELVVASDTDAVALLAALGYEQIFQFEKRREIWRLGDCEIALDEISMLGRFVEIEGPDEPVIQKAIYDLGLEGNPLIRESYVALLMRK